MTRLAQFMAMAVLLSGLAALASCTTPNDSGSWDTGKMWKDWETNRPR